MLIGTVTLVGLTAIVAMLLVDQRAKTFAAQSSAMPSHPASPLDEAERILAHRYATGQISPAEYQRMLAILRR